MTFYHAHLSTSHYHFDAYGQTEIQALAAMRAVMSKHAKQVQINAAQFWADYEDGINCTEVVMGSGYRDNMKVGK